MSRRRALVAVSTLAVLVASLAACHPVVLPAAVVGVAAPRVGPPRAGTGTIVGAAADSGSGYPVIGGAIYFTRDSVLGTGPATERRDLPRATTDRGGGFALRDVPPGEYVLAFSDLDHFPIRTTVVVRADQTHSVVLRPRRRGAP